MEIYLYGNLFERCFLGVFEFRRFLGFERGFIVCIRQDRRRALMMLTFIGTVKTTHFCIGYFVIGSRFVAYWTVRSTKGPFVGSTIADFDTISFYIFHLTIAFWSISKGVGSGKKSSCNNKRTKHVVPRGVVYLY